MLNLLKNKKFDQVGSQDEKNQIFASILLECAKEDGEISDLEKSKIKFLLVSKLKLEDDEAALLFEKTLKLSKNRVEMYSLTREIRENFDKDEIIKILEYMWLIVLSDGKLDDFEAALMSNAVGLFHLTGRESAEARKKAEKNLI